MIQTYRWNLDAGIFIRTMSGIGYGLTRHQDLPTHKRGESSGNLPTFWEDTRLTITDVLKRFAGVGILSGKVVTAKNSLTPLFVLHHTWKHAPDYQFNQALHWFLLANKAQRYRLYTTISEDARIISHAPTFRAARAKLLDRLEDPPTVSPDAFLTHRQDRAGGNFLRLVLTMVLFQRQAKDWVDDVRLGYADNGSPMASGFDPQWHHIFPKSLFKDSDADRRQVMANFTMLNTETNVKRLSGKPPARYIREYQITPERLREHLIPESFIEVVGDEAALQERWDFSQVDDFYEQRAHLLAATVNAFLASLAREAR